MIQPNITPTELFGIFKQLSLREQLELVEQILATLRPQLPATPPTKQPLRSLLGLWQGFTVTEEDIAEARREMWVDVAYTSIG
mgnify:CR=1 FL=1